MARLYEGTAGRQTTTGENCLFPFTYLGVHYEDCVRGGGYGVGYSEWCPTSITGGNRDAGNRKQCAPLKLIGQLNPKDSTLSATSNDLSGKSIVGYDVDALRFRWNIDEVNIPGPGKHYFIELSNDGGNQNKPNSVNILAKSAAFVIECAWYRVELVLTAGASAPESEAAVVAEISRVTDLSANRIHVVSICENCEKGVTIVVDLRGGSTTGAGSGSAPSIKCPVAGLTGLLDFKDRNSAIVPTATIIDFSDPVPTLIPILPVEVNVTNVTKDNT